jgi:hypothetical protein
MPSLYRKMVTTLRVGMAKNNKASENRRPIWPLVLIGVGAVVTLAWVGVLGLLGFRLLALLVSTAAQFGGATLSH